MKQLSSDPVAIIAIEKFWENAEPSSLNQLTRVCAIPHWFDANLAQALADGGPNDAARLAARYPSFIREHPHGYTYHESVRLAFWRKWHLDAAQELGEISNRLVKYLEHIIDTLNSSDRLDCEYERMYHLTTIEPEKGFETLDRFFQIAQDNHQIETCHHLVDWMGEHHDYLPEKYKVLLRYYEGEVERELHHYDVAKSIFSEVLNSRSADELTHAKANNSMALSITGGQTDLSEAFPFLLSSVELLRKINHRYWLGQVLYNLSYVSRLAGRREDAYRYGEEALDLLNERSQAQNVSWLVKKSRVLSELGLVLWLLGKPDEARIRFNEALDIQIEVGAKDPAIETYANLGRLERTSGNWDKAIQQLQNGIQIATETRNQHQMAWTKNALGNVYVEMQDWTGALRCFEESRQLWETIGHQHERGVPVKNLIGVYTALEKWDLAEVAAQDSLKIFASHEGRQGEIYNSIGELRLAQKRYAEARINFEHAQELAEKMKDRKTEPRVHINLAQLYLIENNLQQARQEAESALEQGRAYRQPDRTAQSLMVLGKIDLLEGNIEQAVGDFLSAGSQARTFNPKVYEITVSQVTSSIHEIQHSHPELDWSFFFRGIAAARNSDNETFVQELLRLENGEN